MKCSSDFTCALCGSDHPQKFRLIDDGNAKLIGLVELTAGTFADQHKAGFLADARRGLATEVFDGSLDFVAVEVLQRTGHDDGFAGKGQIASAFGRGLRMNTGGQQVFDDSKVYFIPKIFINAFGDFLSDLLCRFQSFRIRLHERFKRSKLIGQNFR